jgi:diguanylate cyclase (GGDEF)-like protein
MSRISFNRKRVQLKRLMGIRARLALLALIVVGPLMLDRARSLEETRAKEISFAASEFAHLAEHSADAQREVISSVETILKSTAYIRSTTGGISRSCELLRASLPANLPWIRSLSIVGGDGRVQCSSLGGLVGLDLSDRAYIKNARSTRDFVLSDYIFSRATSMSTIIAAYPVSALNADEDAIIIAGVNLDWMSKIMGNLGGRPGVSVALIDSEGTVLATPPDQASMVGRPLDHMSMLPATAKDRTGRTSFIAADGTKRAVTFARIAGTGSLLVVSIDEAKVTGNINREIRTAYLQLAFVCLFLLVGALVAAERLIIKPIENMAVVAKRFGQGDLSVRAAHKGLPAEFVPLARAFNTMTAKLGERERELVATNDRLTVIASIDMLSGLANRRGFQSRLDFEWLKAQQSAGDLALLMIDVDHFKLFNDTYGHPEGDACLSRLGEALADLAEQTDGFASRYGGEEFCLLLPNTDNIRALQIGEMVRETVCDLGMPHSTSVYQNVTVSVGVACTVPSEAQQPKDLIEAADAALYAAKHRGRNTVVEHGFVRVGDGPAALALAS